MKNTIKRQMSFLLIFLATGYIISFIFLFLFTVSNINKNTSTYLNSTAFRLKERIDSTFLEKIDSLHNFSLSLDEDLGRDRYGFNLSLSAAFTRYQFEKDYDSLWYVDRYGKIKIYFKEGYLTSINKGKISEVVLKELDKCKINSYYVVAGPVNSNYFYLIYRPQFRTFEKRGDEHYFVFKYSYDLFYNMVDSIVYAEVKKNRINWSAGFAKNGVIIWSPYDYLKQNARTGPANNPGEQGLFLPSHYLTNIPLTKSNFNIVTAVPKYPILKPLFISYFLAFMFIVISVVLIFLGLRYLNKRLLKPISFLEKATKDVARGKYDIKYPYGFDNEISILGKSFQDMAADIKRLKLEDENKTKLAAIGQTTSQIAHDVRKPLTTLKSLLTILPEKKDDQVYIENLTRSVEKTINRTNAMLSEILEFSTEASTLDIKACDTQSIITAAVSETFSSKDNLDISIVYELKHQSCIKADCDRIIRVLTNIIDNAVDALNGKGKIWIKSFDDTNNSLVRIVIGNDGPLIPAEIILKLFDPFFTRGKKDGVGLGLSISKKIVEMHNGSIAVKSYFNGKKNITEFTVDLPLIQKNIIYNKNELIFHSDELKIFREEELKREKIDDIVNIEDFIKLSKKHGQPFYLLLVDDEPLFRESVRNLINSIKQIRDYVKIVEVDSAENALIQFDSRKFNYIITDIDMGKNRMDGYEFARIILDKYPEIYVLIHSNKRKEEMDKNMREIKNSRFMGFMPKPMSKSDLLHFLACKSFEDSHVKKISDMNSKKVLIVNDDEELLLSFRILLKSSGCLIYEATNINTALKCFYKNKIDIILSDINLGKDNPNGYALLKQVRKNNKEVFFYLMSGYSRSSEESKAIDAGANGYIQLPVEKKELESIIVTS